MDSIIESKDRFYYHDYIIQKKACLYNKIHVKFPQKRVNAIFFFHKVGFNVTLKLAGMFADGIQGHFLHTKKTDFRGTFSGCRTKFHLDVYDIDYSNLRDHNYTLGKISGNLNQIAKRMNVTGNVYKADVAKVKKLMKQVWDTQKAMLAKQPTICLGITT